MNTRDKGEEKVNQGEEAKVERAKREKDEVQVTVSLESERKLGELLERVNQGFDLVRITRKHLLSYVVERAAMNFGDDDVQAVRTSALTDMVLLDKLYREAKESGVIPEALREFLWKSSNLTQGSKRHKKSGLIKYSNAISSDQEAS